MGVIVDWDNDVQTGVRAGERVVKVGSRVTLVASELHCAYSLSVESFGCGCKVLKEKRTGRLSGQPRSKN